MLFARTDKPLALSGGIKPLPEIVHRTEQFEYTHTNDLLI